MNIPVWLCWTLGLVVGVPSVLLGAALAYTAYCSSHGINPFE